MSLKWWGAGALCVSAAFVVGVMTDPPKATSISENISTLPDERQITESTIPAEPEDMYMSQEAIYVPEPKPSAEEQYMGMMSPVMRKLGLSKVAMVCGLISGASHGAALNSAATWVLRNEKLENLRNQIPDERLSELSKKLQAITDDTFLQYAGERFEKCYDLNKRVLASDSGPLGF